jgi:hypothetical protein
MVGKMDRRLGPWAYYWPSWFGTYDSIYTGTSNSPGITETSTYYGGVPTSVDEGLLPLPKQWIGKILIRRGQKPAEEISSGGITNTQAMKYVFEDQIRDPYIILSPTEIASDYITGRLTIYVNSDNVIENVRYG